MKKILIAFLISLVVQDISAQIPYKCSEIDSIYVLSIEYHTDFCIPLYKRRFQEELHYDGMYDIVSDRDKIKKIYNLLNGLIPINRMSDCNELEVISWRRSGVPAITENEHIDIRTLLVLCNQNKQTMVWISAPATEIDCKIYYSSDSLRSFISDYEYKHYYERKRERIKKVEKKRKN